MSIGPFGPPADEPVGRPAQSLQGTMRDDEREMLMQQILGGAGEMPQPPNYGPLPRGGIIDIILGGLVGAAGGYSGDPQAGVRQVDMRRQQLMQDFQVRAQEKDMQYQAKMEEWKSKTAHLENLIERVSDMDETERKSRKDAIDAEIDAARLDIEGLKAEATALRADTERVYKEGKLALEGRKAGAYEKYMGAQISHLNALDNPSPEQQKAKNWRQAAEARRQYMKELAALDETTGEALTDDWEVSQKKTMLDQLDTLMTSTIENMTIDENGNVFYETGDGRRYDDVEEIVDLYLRAAVMRNYRLRLSPESIEILLDGVRTEAIMRAVELGLNPPLTMPEEGVVEEEKPKTKMKEPRATARELERLGPSPQI